MSRSMRELVEEALRANPNWKEHPGKLSPWEDLLADPATSRVRLSLDLAAIRQMQYEGGHNGPHGRVPEWPNGGVVVGVDPRYRGIRPVRWLVDHNVWVPEWLLNMHLKRIVEAKGHRW
jgi:hypothetical protein